MDAKFKLEMVEEEIMQDEKHTVWRNMRQYGGGFVKILGELLIHADKDNARRIKEAFPEYWAKYLKMGEGKSDYGIIAVGPKTKAAIEEIGAKIRRGDIS